MPEPIARPWVAHAASESRPSPTGRLRRALTRPLCTRYDFIMGDGLRVPPAGALRHEWNDDKRTVFLHLIFYGFSPVHGGRLNKLETDLLAT